MTEDRTAVWAFVDKASEEYVGLANDVWAVPELGYHERQSADLHMAQLEANDFTVHRNVAGIPTAFYGEAGSGGPVIALLGEFDALPGMSQKAGVYNKEAVVEGGNGHACGHNLLGAGAQLAATAIKNHLAATGQPGRVRYYGCPAEEGGAAKCFMARAGAFDDVSAVISWHPDAFALVDKARSIASIKIEFEFFGQTAHAAVAPQLGRSAVDAMELMSVGVNYMREHMPSDARVHAAILDSGSRASNVISAYAKVVYTVRSAKSSDARVLVERVKAIAQGAALMTETTVVVTVGAATANLLGNSVLEKLLYDQLVALGPVKFDATDHAEAEKIRQALTDQDAATDFARYALDFQPEVLLSADVIPFTNQGEVSPGSTDIGDVSYLVPTVQVRAPTYVVGTPGHSWQMVAQGKSPIAHKGMIYAAKAMAATGAALLDDGETLKAAREEFEARTARDPYVPLMPADIKPSLPEATDSKT